MSALLDSLLTTFNTYPLVIYFVAAVLGGEELLIPLAILTGHGFGDFFGLYAMGFLGTLLSDCLWFLLGRHGLQQRKIFQRHHGRYEVVSKTIRKLAKTDVGLLMVTKFIYGTRIFTILYLSVEGTSFPRFVKIMIPIILVWLLCVVGMGWLIGKGSTFFLNIYEHPMIASLCFVSLLLLFHFVRHSFSKKFLPNQEV